MNRVSSKIVLALGAAALVAGLQLALVAGSAQADQISSAEFNFGFGYDSHFVDGSIVHFGWTATENADNNSATSQDSFEFSAAPAGGTYSGGGFTFFGRSLEFGTDGYPVHHGSGYVGDSGSNFSVPITAKYTGGPIAGASNYRLILEISKISAYVGEDNVNGGGKAQWAETTEGHTGTSTLIDIPKVAGGYMSSPTAGYTKMEWNATDNLEMALTDLNASVTRTFTIPVLSGSPDRYADGIEIVGRVHLVYDAAVPEPSAIVLLATGLLGLLAYAWRKRK